MSGTPGRMGHKPTCHTEMARWIYENGYKRSDIAKKMGIHEFTVHRHCIGWPIGPTLSKLYRFYFPGIPVPARGRAQYFEHPLPIRSFTPQV